MAHAVILLAHGSRHPQARPLIDRLADAASLHLDLPVEVACIELDTPTLPEAAVNLADRYPDLATVTVIPLLFTRNYHRNVDVPRLVRAAQQALEDAGSTAHVAVGETLHNRALRDVLAEKIRRMPRGSQPVLYAAGRPASVAQELTEHCGREVLWTNRPQDVRDLARCHSHLSVQPLFVSHGLLLDQLYEHVDGHARITCALPLGTDLVPVIAQAVHVVAPVAV